MTQHDSPRDPAYRHYASRPAAWVGLREQFPAVANRPNVAAVFRVRTGQFWHLRLIIVLSLLVPAVLYGWAGWETWSAIHRQADQRIEGMLDVLQEQALKALQTVERSISEINEVLRGMPDEEIRAAEADLYLRFKRTQQALPQIESIWAFDRDGHPLVSSTILPVPRQLDNSDRSYFRAHTEAAARHLRQRGHARPRRRDALLRGQRPAHRRRAGSLRRRDRRDDRPRPFQRVLQSSLRAAATSSPWCGPTARCSPAGPKRTAGDQPAPGALTEAFARNPEGGLFTAASRLDGVERRTGYRRVPGYPLYVAAGIDTAALAADFRRTMLLRGAVVLPAVLALFGLAIYALRRAERWEQELQRREAPRPRSSRRSGSRPSAS